MAEVAAAKRLRDWTNSSRLAENWDLFLPKGEIRPWLGPRFTPLATAKVESTDATISDSAPWRCEGMDNLSDSVASTSAMEEPLVEICAADLDRWATEESWRPTTGMSESGASKGDARWDSALAKSAEAVRNDAAALSAPVFPTRAEPDPATL